MLPITQPAYEALASQPVRVYDCRYVRNKTYPPHVDGSHRISMVLSGRVKETAGGREYFGSATSLVLKPGYMEHANQFGPGGARLLSLIFPEKELDNLGLHGFFDQLTWLKDPATGALIVQFLRSLFRKDDLASATVDLLGGISIPRRSLPEKKPPPWLEDVQEFIQDLPRENWTVQEIARRFDLHPVYLARRFRQHLGCTVKEYIHRIKLERIADRLSGSSDPLVHIALDMGYADQPHMSRVFKQRLGISPGAFRRICRAMG